MYINTHLLNIRFKFISILTLFAVILSITIANASILHRSSRNDRIKYSMNPDRSKATTLSGQTVSGKIYIFVVEKNKDIDDVFFYLDTKLSDKEIARKWETADFSDYKPPFDLKGGSTKTANALDTTLLTNGTHSVGALIKYQSVNGKPKWESYKTASFIVNNSSSTPTTKPSTTTKPTTPTTKPSTTTKPTTPTTKPPTTTTTPTTSNVCKSSDAFCDDFSGSSLADISKKWKVYDASTLDYEQACYTSDFGSNGNVDLKNGLLVVRAKYQSSNKCGGGRSYTSGYVSTKDAGKFKLNVKDGQVGRIEFMAQLPNMQPGAWPALWSRNGRQDPNYGELDIMEKWFDNCKNSSGCKVNAAEQYEVNTHIKVQGNNAQNNINKGINLSQGMHLYATEIDTVKKEVRYYLDNDLIATHRGNTVKSGKTSITDDHFKQILISDWDLRIMIQVVKQGDGWHSAATPQLNTEMKVDYVRAFYK